MKKSNPWQRLNRLWDQLFEKPATGAKTPTYKNAPPMPPVKPAKTEPYVYITKTGKKFHYDADCQGLANAWARNEVTKTGLSKARASGRTACSRCCFDYLRD